MTTERVNSLGNVMMFLILAQLIMIDVKNYWTDKSMPKDLYGYSYIVAFGLPMTLISLVASDIVYEKYLSKLQESHSAIYNKLLGFLVSLTLSVVAFFVMFSFYMT